MNKEVKEKWVAALRSGDYKQGFNRLKTVMNDLDGKDVSSYCCLGVLCDLASKEGIIKELNHGFFGTSLNNCNQFSLPVEVAKWVEIDMTGEMTILARYNDKHKLTFNQISDFIERDKLNQDSKHE